VHQLLTGAVRRHCEEPGQRDPLAVPAGRRSPVGLDMVGIGGADPVTIRMSA
jgi:hypothetical protein